VAGRDRRLNFRNCCLGSSVRRQGCRLWRSYDVIDSVTYDGPVRVIPQESGVVGPQILDPAEGVRETPSNENWVGFYKPRNRGVLLHLTGHPRNSKL